MVCLNELKLRLSSSSLNVKDNKTETISFGPKENCAVDLDLGSFFAPYKTHCAQNLGVVFDDELKSDKRISAVVKSCFFSIFAFLLKVKPFISPCNFQSVIHAFVSIIVIRSTTGSLSLPAPVYSRCNTQLPGFSLAGTREHEPVPPTLINLHWLPVKYRIDFKMLLFVYKSLNDSAPRCSTDLPDPNTPSRMLPSCDLAFLTDLTQI